MRSARGTIVRAVRTKGAQSELASNGMVPQLLDLNGVADGIRTHNNWNHIGAIGDVTPIKSNASETIKRPKTHKTSR